MFTHMIQVKKETHTARNEEYELNIYQVEETGQYRIFISKSGNSVGGVYTATDEVVKDSKSLEGPDIIEELLNIAKNDIERNEFKQF